MIPDSSALVAAFAPWHEHHDVARHALRGIDDLIAHTEIEAYSVLTRLPAPFRAPPQAVADHLARRHPGARLVLPPAERRRFLARLTVLPVSGGAVYDALVAATALHAGRVLVSLDRRAAAVYAQIGVDVECLVPG